MSSSSGVPHRLAHRGSLGYTFGTLGHSAGVGYMSGHDFGWYDYEEVSKVLLSKRSRGREQSKDRQPSIVDVKSSAD